MNWLQFGYQYLVGGLFFLVTFYLCFRPGASDLDNPSDRRAFIYLIIGFVAYLGGHALWIVIAGL